MNKAISITRTEFEFYMRRGNKYYLRHKDGTKVILEFTDPDLREKLKHSSKYILELGTR